MWVKIILINIHKVKIILTNIHKMSNACADNEMTDLLQYEKRFYFLFKFMFLSKNVGFEKSASSFPAPQNFNNCSSFFFKKKVLVTLFKRWRGWKLVSGNQVVNKACIEIKLPYV